MFSVPHVESEVRYRENILKTVLNIFHYSSYLSLVSFFLIVEVVLIVIYAQVTGTK